MVNWMLTSIKSVRTLICIVSAFYSFSVTSQEIPPIQSFSPQDYKAENQNWAIAQSEERLIYVANNQGLLEYNGATWNLYQSPNQTILRSICTDSKRIYTGSYMDFGYWEKDNTNTLIYTSIVQDQAIKLREDEEFWGITASEEYIVFQSFESIYIFNSETSEYSQIRAKNRINKLFAVNGNIYFQDNTYGLFKIVNGKAKMEIPSDVFDSNEIITVFNIDSGLALVTKNSGVIYFERSTSSEWRRKEVSDEWAKERTVYSALQLSDGSVVLGTISHGILQLSPEGSILMAIDQSTGLNNNTVLSLFEDLDGNIWLGLDNGINLINLKSPFKVYTDKLGQLGTVYTACIFEDYLYLGTNQGLFYKPLNSTSTFQLVEGTKGQVWSLDVIEDNLFCGHDNGTFRLTDGRIQLVSNTRGTWGVKSIPQHEGILLQGNYKGLYTLEGVNGDWKFRNKIQGFDISSRYFEFIDANTIIVSHEYKGVYLIRIDEGYNQVLSVNELNISSGIKSSIETYDGSVIYTYNEGVFRFNIESKSFEKDTLLSSYLTADKFHSGKLLLDADRGRLWGFSKDEIIYAEPGPMTDELEIKTIALPAELRETKAGFESVLYLGNSEYLFGTTTGYFIVDLEKIDVPSPQIVLSSLKSQSGQNEELSQPLSSSEKLELPNDQNKLSFTYSVPAYDGYTDTKYQFKLEGLYNDWSEWSSIPEASFENLPHGTYTFYARARTGDVISDNTLQYAFIIDKPFYLKPVAFALYVLAFLILAFGMHYANRRYYKQQQKKLILEKERERELEQLENQRQIVEFKNENLKLDIENKNRELGMAAMNLVKRNELLNEIKLALTKIETTNDVKPVVKRINRNLNDTSDWKLFEEAFNNVDKDFMKSVKALHPSITPNDLRLCAYLRLNLSSKEIAPLLNISHKSVEVKRYRLRKKMGLGHDVSLSNYIINL